MAAPPLGSLGREGLAMSDMTSPQRQESAVRLIDRRTGQTHRINGSPLVLFTKAPEEAVTELLQGRDTSVWEARIERPGSNSVKTGGHA